MFEQDSRYSDVETATLDKPDGSRISYKRRRFLRPAERSVSVAEIVVTEGQRVDLIASSTLGDPELFWRICDANNAMNPFELTEKIGSTLSVAVPQGS